MNSCRRVGRFCRHSVAQSAAVGYASADDSRRARPLRNAARPRLGPAGRVFARAFRRRGALFRRRGARRARFRRQIRPAVGGSLAPPPRREKRRRRGGEPTQPARGRGGAARRRRVSPARSGARAGGAGLFRLPRPRRSRRPLPPRAARCRRRRPAGAARGGTGVGARRGAHGGGGARPAGPGRRGRGRRGGHGPAGRRRAARPLLRRRRAGEGPQLAGSRSAARRRGLAAVLERGTAAAPLRAWLDESRGARLRARGARRPRHGARPFAPRGSARGRRAKAAGQGKDRRHRGAARRRRGLRRGADSGFKRPRPPAAVRAPGVLERRARAHRPQNLPALRALTVMARRPNPEPDFDRELVDLPPNLRWRDWKARVEAVLFAAAKPVSRETLARVVGRDCALDLLLDDLREDFRGRPIELVRAGESFTLHTRPAFGPAVRVAFDIPADAKQLTKLEAGVLMAVAMFQPVTRGEMSEMFGREISRDLIAGLREEGLIAAGLRSPKVGAPYAFVTTEKFLFEFGLESLRDLPDLEELEDAGLLGGASREEPGRAGLAPDSATDQALADLAGVLGLRVEEDESEEDAA